MEGKDIFMKCLNLLSSKRKAELFAIFFIVFFVFLSFFSCSTTDSAKKTNPVYEQQAKNEFSEYDSRILKKEPEEFLVDQDIYLIILRQAIDMYNEAIKTEDFDLLDQAGKYFYYVYGKTGLQSAKDYLLKIREYKSKKLASYIASAKKSEKNKDIITAAVFWGKVLRLDPSNKEAKEFFKKNKAVIEQEVKKNLEKAKKYVDQGKFTQAEKLYNSVLLYDPDNQEAKAGLEKIKKMKEELAKSNFKKGVDYFNKKDYDNAIKCFKLALSYGYDKNAINIYLDKIEIILNIEKYYQKALDAFNNQDYFAAYDFSQEVIRLDPNYKDIKELNAKIKKAIEDKILTMYNNAVELYNQKRYQEALDIFKKIAEYNASYQDVQYYIQSCIAKIESLSQG